MQLANLVIRDFVEPWFVGFTADPTGIEAIRHMFDGMILALNRRIHAIHPAAVTATAIAELRTHLVAYNDALVQQSIIMSHSPNLQLFDP